MTHRLKIQEFLFGVPDIGMGHLAEMRVEVWYNNNGEIEEVKAALASHVPGLGDKHVKSETCLYTQTPDGHFVVGMLPGQKNIVVAGGFSGHGFKFTPVIGEILKDLALEGKTRFDISGFDLARFG